MSKLFVGNISYKATEDDLQAVFENNGFECSSVTIITDKDTGRSKGFGFVELNDDKRNSDAIKVMDQKDLGGRAISVKPANPPKRNGGGGGGYRRDEPRW